MAAASQGTVPKCDVSRCHPELRCIGAFALDLGRVWIRPWYGKVPSQWKSLHALNGAFVRDADLLSHHHTRAILVASVGQTKATRGSLG